MPTFLQKHRPGVFNNMVLNGTLYSHLVEVDEAAQHRLDVLMPQLAKAAGATEELKARDQMAWVGLINNCKARVEEIIRAELFHTKIGETTNGGRRRGPDWHPTASLLPGLLGAIFNYFSRISLCLSA